jgi:hypothetical protein
MSDRHLRIYLDDQLALGIAGRELLEPSWVQAGHVAFGELA